MTIVPYTPETRARDWIGLMGPAVELAKQVANTDFVKRAMRGNPAAICAAILYGDEVGLGPMQSLAKIDVIDGRPSLAAEAQRALILAAGHDLWVEEHGSTRVTVAGRRRDSDETTRVTWTLDDAKRAGLAGKPTWRAYPRQMLLARASAELARVRFADVIGGMPATEEVLEDTEPAEPVELAAVADTKRTRQRRRASAQVSAGAPEPPPAPPGPEEPPLPVDDDAPPEGPPPEPEPPPVPDAGEPAEGEPTPMITDRDRRFLHARKNELGMSDDTLKDLIEGLTGQRSTTKVPAAQFGDLLTAMQQRQLDAERVQEEQQSTLDVGRPAHDDRA